MALSLPASALGAKPSNTNTTVQSNLLPKPIQPAHVKPTTAGSPGSASSLLVRDWITISLILKNWGGVVPAVLR